MGHLVLLHLFLCGGRICYTILKAGHDGVRIMHKGERLVLLELCDAASEFGKSLSRGGAGDLDVEAPPEDFTEEEVERAG